MSERGDDLCGVFLWDGKPMVGGCALSGAFGLPYSDLVKHAARIGCEVSNIHGARPTFNASRQQAESLTLRIKSGVTGDKRREARAALDKAFDALEAYARLNIRNSLDVSRTNAVSAHTSFHPQLSDYMRKGDLPPCLTSAGSSYS